MMINGSLFAIADLNVAQQLIGKRNLVVISDLDESIIKSLGGIPASVLIPPYETLVIKHDENDMEKYQQSYNEYLSSDVPTLFIAGIIKALHLGKDIVFIMTNDDASLFFEQLNNYFITNFGIYIGTQFSEFKYDTRMDWKICSTLYETDNITAEEFMIDYPKEIYFTDDSILKMIKDLKPCIKTNKLEEYGDYFYRYKETIKKANKFLKIALEKVE